MGDRIIILIGELFVADLNRQGWLLHNLNGNGSQETHRITPPRQEFAALVLGSVISDSLDNQVVLKTTL